MPWDEYALELGAFTAHADRFSSPFIVSIEQITAPMALCKLNARSRAYPHAPLGLWIAILYDRTGTEEPEDETSNSNAENGGLT
ncbi:hypothetical protein FRC08_005754 [Ceratobasidium sp. 394]|nr:hypothetical protein FRC08_005754 [Ceratobasidium sp. 394]